MFSGENWRVEAVVRLVVSIMITVSSGALIMALLYGRPHISSPLFAGEVVGGLLAFAGAMALLYRPVRLERLASRVAIIATLFYAGLFLATYARKAAAVPDLSLAQMIVSAFTLQGAILLLSAVFLRRHQAGWVESFGLNKEPLNALGFGLLAAVIFLPLGWGLQWVSVELLQRIPGLHFNAQEQLPVQFLRTVNTYWHKAVLGLITVVLAPVAEEVLFRGVLYRWIQRIGYPGIALWLVAFIFAFLHANAASFVPLACFSVLLCVLYDKTGNLASSVVAHAIFNGVNFALLLLWNRPGHP